MAAAESVDGGALEGAAESVEGGALEAAAESVDGGALEANDLQIVPRPERPVPKARDGKKERFRPVWHGIYLPEELAALEDANPFYRAGPTAPEKPEKPLSEGFTQVHVSGLPADCEDEAVAAKLRQCLIESRRRAEAAAATAAAASALAASATESPTTANADEEDLQPEIGDREAGHRDEDREVEAAEIPKVSKVEEPFATCAVVRDKDTHVCKGYCFLSFKTLIEAEAAAVFLNEGVEVAGAEVKAQVSRPKAQKVKPPPKSAAPQPEQHDLRCRRARYAAVSSKAQHGRFTKTSGTNEAGEAHVTRNSAGRINDVCGTRGRGQQVEFEDSKCSTRSGFKA